MIDGMIQLLTELTKTYDDDYKETVVVVDFSNRLKSIATFKLARIDGVRASILTLVEAHIALASIGCGNIEYWYGGLLADFYKLSDKGRARIDELNEAVDNLLKEVQQDG